MTIHRVVDVPTSEVPDLIADFELQGWEVTKIDQGGGLWTIEARKPAGTASTADTASTAGTAPVAGTAPTADTAPTAGTAPAADTAPTTGTAPAADTATTAGGSGIVATGSEAPGSILHKDKIDRLNFYARFRKLFSPSLKQMQVDGYNAILDEWERNSGLQDLRWLAYMLATAYHETGKRIEPVREGFAKTDNGAVNAVTKLFNQGRIKKNYALADPPGSGLHYFGRGLVQLTHRVNYLKMGNLLGLGMQLVSNPSLALNLEISAKKPP